MRLVLAQTVVMLFLITSLGAAQPQKPGEPASAKATLARQSRVKRLKAYQVGFASWYGKHFHGKKTASGEAYDMFQFTAAHPALPLGTKVRVTNLRNRRWVVVRVNDRGPLSKSRIIDLSYGAAQMLDLHDNGLDRVRLDLVQPNTVALANIDLADTP